MVDSLIILLLFSIAILWNDKLSKIQDLKIWLNGLFQSLRNIQVLIYLELVGKKNYPRKKRRIRPS